MSIQTNSLCVFGCVHRLSQFVNVDKFLKNVSLLGMGKNPTTPLFSDTAKHDFFYEKETIRNVKIAKRSCACKGYLCMFL